MKNNDSGQMKPGELGSISRSSSYSNSQISGSVRASAAISSHTLQRSRKPVPQHTLLTLPRSHSSYRQFSSTAVGPASGGGGVSNIAVAVGSSEQQQNAAPSSALSSTQHSPLEDTGLIRRKKFQVDIFRALNIF